MNGALDLAVPDVEALVSATERTRCELTSIEAVAQVDNALVMREKAHRTIGT